MKKTININLAGLFFHIDEDAYQILDDYLKRIKQAFTDPVNRIEILADVEARIAELFNERIKSDRQVVTYNDVNDIIAIMGQPEDYMMNEDEFETHDFNENYDSEASASTKKIYRDIDNAYVGGVSAGLAHYFGIDPLWIRLLWAFLFFGAGTGLFMYLLLWCLLPEAKTTAQKLAMRGKSVNISNIQQKVKEGFNTVVDGFDEVTDKLKNVDYSKIQDKSTSFFESVSKLLMGVVKFFGKFIGVIVIITASIAVFSLLIGVFMKTSFRFFNYDLNITNQKPKWLLFLVIGIPLFWLFYLGFKLLISNSKSLPKNTKSTLLVIWVLAIIGVNKYDFKDNIFESEKTSYISSSDLKKFTVNDTIYLSMSDNKYFDNAFKRKFKYKKIIENNEVQYVSRGVRLIIKSTPAAYASIKVEKQISASNSNKFKGNTINYDYYVNDKTIYLDSYFIADKKYRSSTDEVKVTVYLPIGSVFYGKKNTYAFHKNEEAFNDIFRNGQEEKYLKVAHDNLTTLKLRSASPTPMDTKSKMHPVNVSIDSVITITTSKPKTKPPISEDSLTVN